MTPTAPKRLVTLPSSPEGRPYIGRITHVDGELVGPRWGLFLLLIIEQPVEHRLTPLSYTLVVDMRHAETFEHFMGVLMRLGITKEEATSGSFSKLLTGKYMSFDFVEGADAEGINYSIEPVALVEEPAEGAGKEAEGSRKKGKRGKRKKGQARNGH